MLQPAAAPRKPIDVRPLIQAGAEHDMIIERLVFRARFGQGDQVSQAFRAWRDQFSQRFDLKARVMVDVTGPMFTVVVESEYRDMAHVAQMTEQMPSMFGQQEFQQWFGTWQGAVELGSRELYQVVE
jgi:hypothetical protein